MGFRAERKRAKRGALSSADRAVQAINDEIIRRGKRAIREGRAICTCGPDLRKYASKAEADADQAPAAICTECSKEKIIVKLNAK